MVWRGRFKDTSVNLSSGRYSSFVIRVWSRNGRVVQGEITHVATGESVRFRDIERMIAFIRAHVAPLTGECAGLPAQPEEETS